MKLVSNWRAVLLRGWSTYVNALASALGYAVSYFPVMQDYVSPRIYFAVFGSLFVLSTIVRLIQQRSVSGAGKGVSDAGR